MKKEEKRLFWQRVEVLGKMAETGVQTYLLRTYGDELNKIDSKKYNRWSPEFWLNTAIGWRKPHKRLWLTTTCSLAITVSFVVISIAGNPSGWIMVLTGITAIVAGAAAALPALHLFAQWREANIGELKKFFDLVADILTVEVGDGQPIVSLPERVSLEKLYRFGGAVDVRNFVLAGLTALRPDVRAYVPARNDTLRDIPEARWRSGRREAFERLNDAAVTLGIISRVAWHSVIFPPM